MQSRRVRNRPRILEKRPLFLWLSLALLWVCIALWAGSVVWVIGDSLNRGRSGLAFAIVLCSGPFCAIGWWLLRPPSKLTRWPLDRYTNADDALSAAARLEMLGEWDQAITLYEHVANQWPDQGEYILRCIDAVRAK